MIDQDYDRFCDCMVMLAEILGPKALSKAIYRAYFNALKDKLTFEQVQSSCALAVQTCKFFPKPVELLELVLANKKDEALVALDTVTSAIGTHGSYRTLVFEDPVIHAAIESMGGWPAFCEREPDEWLRKEFLEAYQSHARRLRSGDMRAVPLQLTGRLSGENIARGYADPVSYVGDKAKCLAWQSETRKFLSGSPEGVSSVAALLPNLCGPKKE